MTYYINNTIPSLTRYDMSKFMEFTIDDYTILDSYFCSKIKDIPYSGTITISNQAGRPDLISYDVYGSTQYWWVIMLYNDLTCVTDINVGDVYKYPGLAALENLYFTLSTKQKAKDTNKS